MPWLFSFQRRRGFFVSLTMNRIDRLTAILIHLQTKRVVRAEELSDRFEISLRTVYRDVKALMEAGVPVGSEAGKGYFLVDGYHLPPVMFTQDEASAMLMAGKLVEKMTDKSIRTAFESSLAKITAVLQTSEKDRLESLHKHIEVRQSPRQDSVFPDHFLTDIQHAIVDKEVLRLEYYSGYNEEVTTREVEPIGLFYYSQAWHLIAWCRLRSNYRDFRADRIKALVKANIRFDGRNLITFQDYLDTLKLGNQELQHVTILFDKAASRYVSHMRYAYGFLSEEDLGNTMRMTFMTGCLNFFCRWLLSCGNAVSLESPPEARNIMRELLEELAAHHGVETEYAATDS